MLLSKLIGERKKSAPCDSMMKSHILLTRAGYIKQVGSGIFTLSNAGLRVCQKIEAIIRREMDALAGSQEIKMPVVLPSTLWEESGRFETVGEELVRFKDRAERGLLLGMTHEEAAVDFARANVVSYSQLPFMIYQIQTKFRDEARSRAGLIRVREFVMKDAYSFHLSERDLKSYYNKVLKAYERIFRAVGIENFIVVGSDSGMMGGSLAHEFMALNQNGEDTLAVCPACDYKVNMEVAPRVYKARENGQKESEIQSLSEVYTKDAKEIEQLASQLNLGAESFIKAVVFCIKGSEQLVCVFIRGDLEVNEAKLKRVLKSNIAPYVAKGDEAIAFGNIGCINPPEFSKIIYDKSLLGAVNMISGANKSGFHLKGISVERDTNARTFVDVAKVKEGDACAKCGHPISLVNGIEIGNIFQLGTKYSKSMGFTVQSSQGELVNPIMGCYGIGVGRTLACVVEENSDEKGIRFPIDVAPWQVYLCGLRLDDASVAKSCKEIYKKLEKSGIEVLFDDRTDVSAGIKFNDCELMGIPIRMVVSKKGLERGIVEISLTGEGNIGTECAPSNVVKGVKAFIKELKKPKGVREWNF